MVGLFRLLHDLVLRDRLGANAVAVQLPIGAGDTFEGIIDLIEMKAYYFDSSEMGAVVEQRDIPEDMQDMAEIWRHDIVERIAELDDELTELYSELEQVTINSVKEANIVGFKEYKSKTIAVGSKYRTYYVLEYALGSANKILISQIKNNALLEGSLHASKAYKELEKEITNIYDSFTCK